MEQKPNVKAVPAARWKAKRDGIDLSKVRGSGPGGVILPRDIEQARITHHAVESMAGMEKVRASTLARRLAERSGVSLKAAKGTGTRGRIMMSDVMRVSEGPTPLGTEGTKPQEGLSLLGQTFPMTQMRRVIAKRMSQSASTAPHVYFFTDVGMDPLVQLREGIVDEFEKEFKVRISINDFFIKAVALIIREFPLFNAMVKGEEISIRPDINVGLAVALQEGLIVPSIPQADRYGLGRIAQMRTDLVERARSGKLKLEEIDRGTFTVSSLAQFDILFFTAILNPPQTGILTVGKTADQVYLKEGQVATKKVAHLGLSVDHRIIDGAVAATFLQSLKKRLENPAPMVMDL